MEQVFNIPGLGRVLLTAISNRDYPVVEGVILCLTLFIVGINTLVDIIYKKVDPRMDVE